MLRTMNLGRLKKDKEMVSKTTRGGTRKGAGAKPKYNEKTTTVSFRCPISKIDELKFLLRAKLSECSIKSTK